MGWQGDAPEWAAIEAAARRCTPLSDLRTNSLWPIYRPIVVAAHAERPLVIGQLGQSIDGRIATNGGRSEVINGAAAIMHLHRLRALVDAVVVGVGTALADDPRLTVRETHGRSPARVIVDPSARLSAAARCLRDDGVRRIVIQAAPHRQPAGVESLRLAAGEDGFAPGDIIAALQGLGLRRLLIEGGGTTISRFIAGGRLDRLHVMIAPMIIGSGQMGIQLPAITALDGALRPQLTAYPLPGGDILCDCAIAPPFAD